MENNELIKLLKAEKLLNIPSKTHCEKRTEYLKKLKHFLSKYVDVDVYLNDGYFIQDILYSIKNNTELQHVYCKWCGKEVHAESGNYPSGCSLSCRTYLSQEKRTKTNMERYGVPNGGGSAKALQKIKNTCIERYGVDNPWKSDVVKEKIKETCLERYGVEHILKSEEMRNRIKETCLEKYGVDSAAKSKEVRNKIKETCLEKYGVDNAWKSKEIKEKIEKTNIERYNAKCTLNNPEIRNKAIKTWIKNYGVDHPMKNKEYRISMMKKFNRGSSSAELSILEFIKELYNGEVRKDYDVLNGRELDIYIPDLKIAFEYNGIYWHSFQKNNDMNVHLNKTLGCENKNIRLFHIWESEYIKNIDNLLEQIYKIIFNKIDDPTDNIITIDRHWPIYTSEQLSNYKLIEITEPKLIKLSKYHDVADCGQLIYILNK